MTTVRNTTGMPLAMPPLMPALWLLAVTTAPSGVKRVFTLCTPGETVAAVVTEAGIALNPKHRNYQELKEDLEKTNLKLVSIQQLHELSTSMTGEPKAIETTDRITCIVEYREF